MTAVCAECKRKQPDCRVTIRATDYKSLYICAMCWASHYGSPEKAKVTQWLSGHDSK